MTARRVEFRPEVADDVASVVEWLDEWSPTAGSRFGPAVLEAAYRVSDSPGIGSLKEFPQPQLHGLRSWAVRGFPNHLVYYLLRGDVVVVLAVLHGMRDVNAILENRGP